LYIQDDFHVASNVTINLGLRYELAPPMHDAHQQMSSIDYSKVPSPQAIFASGKTGFYNATLFVCGQSGYPDGCAYTDKNNFAPRLGVVWSATKKTVIKVGGGIFYANNDANPLFRLAAGLPNNIAQTLSSNNFVPQYHNLSPFGSNIVGPVQIQAAGIDINQRSSYSMQWNLSVQHELARGTVLEVGYLATMGLKLEQNVQPNNANPGLTAVDPRRPYLGVQYAPGIQFPSYITVVGNTVPVGQINYLPHSAQSNYESLFARLEKRFSRGVSFLSSYTWSKAITNAPQFRNAGGVNGNENSPPQDSYNLAAERSLASFNVAHRFINTVLYDLPIPKNKGFGSKIFGDIQLSGILSIQTGFPFTVNVSGDTAGAGAGTGGIFIRPNYILGQNVDLSGSARSTDHFFNTAAFSLPPAGAYGNLGRDTIVGPGLTDLDMVIAKNISLRESVKLQLRVECFNIFNHPNYNIVGRIINDPTTFGKVLSQLDPRQVQFGAKLQF
jgi:TonB dependent receptor